MINKKTTYIIHETLKKFKNKIKQKTINDITCRKIYKQTVVVLFHFVILYFKAKINKLKNKKNTRNLLIKFNKTQNKTKQKTGDDYAIGNSKELSLE